MSFYIWNRHVEHVTRHLQPWLRLLTLLDYCVATFADVVKAFVVVTLLMLSTLYALFLGRVSTTLLICFFCRWIKPLPIVFSLLSTSADGVKAFLLLWPLLMLSTFDVFFFDRVSTTLLLCFFWLRESNHFWLSSPIVACMCEGNCILLLMLHLLWCWLLLLFSALCNTMEC